jgi:hypothetical protein
MTTRTTYHGTRFLELAFTIATLLSGTARAQHFEYKEHHLGPTGLFGVTSPSFLHTLNLRQNHND